MIAIIDYDTGNVRSVQKAIQRAGYPCIITRDERELERCEKIILPGVGNFEKGISNLRLYGLIDLLTDQVIGQKKKILGICLGMQLMTGYSEEGECDGLGWIEATTRLFRPGSLKVPHIGWNTVDVVPGRIPDLDVTINDEFYFVHSYYVECVKREDSLFTTDYGIRFDSGFLLENIMGVQFHPEKSLASGMKVLNAFLKM